MVTTVVETQQRIEDDIHTLVDVSKLEKFVRTKNAVLFSVQYDSDEQSKRYGGELQQLKQQLQDSKNSSCKMEELSDSVKNVRSKLAYFQQTIKDQKEQILVASEKLKESADAAVSAEMLVTPLQAKTVKSEKRPKQLSLELNKAQESLAGYIDVMKKKTVSAHAAKLKLQEDLKAVRAEIPFHHSRWKGKLDQITATYKDSKAPLDESRKDLVE